MKLIITSLLILFFAAVCEAAYYPLEITNMKPAGTGTPAIPATNRIFRAYPGITYDIRPAVIGGMYPYTYSLSGQPSGMTVDSATGKITWVNPQSDSGTITLSVTDSEDITETATWAVAVSTSGFVFMDSNYSGTETGSITQPFSTWSNMMAGTTAVTDIMYMREGTYPLPAGTEKSEFYINNKPQVYIGYPGETAIISKGPNNRLIRSDYSDTVGTYLDNLTFDDWVDKPLMLAGGHHYITIKDCDFKNLVATDSVNNNQGFIIAESSVGNPGFYSMISYNEFSYFTGTSGIGSLYDMSKLLISDNYIHDAGGGGVSNLNNAIAPKSRMNRITIRHNRIIMPEAYSYNEYLGSARNSLLFDTTGIEICFNLFKGRSKAEAVHNFNFRVDGPWLDFYYYRNTLEGIPSFQNLDGSNCNVVNGPFTVANNVIINTNVATSGSTMHDYISYYNGDTSNSPWNCVADTDNLKATSGTIDSSGYLLNPEYVGVYGWETGGEPADEIPPTTTSNKSGRLIRTEANAATLRTHTLACSDNVSCTETLYCLATTKGGTCTPNIEYTEPFRAGINLPWFSYCYASSDSTNTEAGRCVHGVYQTR